MPVTAPVRESARSARWDGAAPPISVVVSTHNRVHYLRGLLDALEEQQCEGEVVIADNGSADGTWALLRERCRTTTMPLLVMRLDPHDGPAVPRNTAVAQTRAPLLAFTDDDCLPAPSWLCALIDALDPPAVAIAQGRTEPNPGEGGRAWGRTLRVEGVTGLFETANLGCTRAAFDAADGFPATRLLRGRAFGEDVVFGHRAATTGTVAFAERALVRHRVVPATYRDHLSERRRLAGFPALLAAVPALRQSLVAGVFLTRRTLVTDIGLAGLLSAALARSPLPAIAAVPWALRCWQDAGGRPGRARPLRAAQLAVADCVGAAALVGGSIRHRRLVL